MFIFDHPISELEPASYNPRYISDHGIDRLQESIRELGVVKPVIVRNRTIIAGHQRTKALKLMGAETVPAYLLGTDVNMYDEVLFNQLHNGTDLDSGDENCRIDGGVELGFQVIGCDRLRGDQSASMAVVRDALEQLIRRYGPWGAIVATKSGKVIHCGQYCLASMALRTPVLCYGIADEQEEIYSRRLNAQYGVFSYEHIEKLTYIQTKAQPNRRVGDGGVTDPGHLESNLYNLGLLPWLDEQEVHQTTCSRLNARVGEYQPCDCGARLKTSIRCFDFGSGKAHHAKDMRNKGYNILDVELFRRVPGAETIDAGAVNRMISRMCRSLTEHGPFEAVVCDSVVNSVDSLDAERAVMTVLNAVTKVGGRLFFAGRTLEKVHARMQSSSHSAIAKDHHQIQFLSKDGFSAFYMLGHWVFQKFHDEEGAARLATEYGFRIDVHDHLDSPGFGWQIYATKLHDLPWEQVAWAADFEFTLPLSKERRLDRNEDVKTALKVHWKGG